MRTHKAILILTSVIAIGACSAVHADSPTAHKQANPPKSPITTSATVTDCGALSSGGGEPTKSFVRPDSTNADPFGCLADAVRGCHAATMNYTVFTVDTGTSYVLNIAPGDHGCRIAYTSQGFGPVPPDSPAPVTSHICKRGGVTPAETLQLEGCTPGPDLGIAPLETSVPAAITVPANH